MPGDMMVNEELPAYLVRKFAAIQQKLDARGDTLDERAEIIHAYSKTQREFAEQLNCDSDNESILKAIHTLQQKLDAVLAENAELKTIVEGVNSELYGKGFEVSGWHLNGSLEPLDNWFTDNGWGCPETPATDTILNSVRAEGADTAAAKIRKAISAFKDVHSGAVNECADIAEMVADQLRAGNSEGGE